MTDLGGDRSAVASVKHERDYLERTIQTVRNHRDADNCWPSWANIFADEIERLWEIEAACASVVAIVERYGRVWAKDTDYYAAAEALGIKEPPDGV